MPALLIGVALAAAALLAFPLRTASARRLLRFAQNTDGALPVQKHALARPGRRFPQLFTKGPRPPFAGPPPGLRDPAMVLELVAAMLQAGSGLGRALELVSAVAAKEVRDPLRPVISALAIGTDWDTAWGSHNSTSNGRLPDMLLLRDALAFAAYTGAPSASILYAQAARLRRERFRLAEKRAAALGVKLVIPLGLCSLPAFICLGVVPVLLALVPSAG